MSNRKVEREQLSAQFINQSFVRKLEEGRVKEAQDEGSRFIRYSMVAISIIMVVKIIYDLTLGSS